MSRNVPKLLDFSIEKLIDDDLGDNPDGITKTGVSHLTPEYSSPEQIKGEKITTASDIYSLGILVMSEAGSLAVILNKAIDKSESN